MCVMIEPLILTLLTKNQDAEIDAKLMYSKANLYRHFNFLSDALRVWLQRLQMLIVRQIYFNKISIWVSKSER
jgi:hypothetical protein